MKRYLTDQTHRMECSTVDAKAFSTAPEMRLVKVYPRMRYQRIEGFGGAITEAAGFVYALMPPSEQRRFAQLCFGKDGNRYNLARTSIQSCDFSLGPRSYLNDPADTTLRTFSIDDDFAYVIPLALDALRENPGLEFLASPWSPPAQLKSNQSMKGGGHLKRRYYKLWARMIARYVAEYRALGIPVTRLTTQNEPGATQTWESCLFTTSQELDFVRAHLKPALAEAGLADVKVLAWDHNKESVLDRAQGLLANPASAGDVDGIAFHWYSGDHFRELAAVRDFIGADRELIFTEGCDSYSAGNVEREMPHAEHYAHEVVGDLEAGANAVIDWNVLLDEQGGPNHVGNYCDAPLMYDTQAEHLNVRLPFYYLGHFSRFMQRGAVRVLSSSFTTDLETCAVTNPDGSHAAVVLNRTGRSINFNLTWGTSPTHGRIAELSSPPHSIQTLVW